MKDVHNLGVFDTLEKVWDSYPYGGCPGDYVTIGGEIVFWNDERRVWGEFGDDISSDKEQLVEGNLTVDKNLTVGGHIKGDTAEFNKIVVDELEMDNPPFSLKGHNHDGIYAFYKHKHTMEDISDFNGSEGGSGSGSSESSGNCKLSKAIKVTAQQTGYLKTGDILSEGMSFEDIFISMLSKKESALLIGKLSTSNDLEFGSGKGEISYTVILNGQGPVKNAFIDNSNINKLNFSEVNSGQQTAVRRLNGYYTAGESYKATVVLNKSADGSLGELTLNNTISVNVKRKWFAGVCSSIPQSSADVRALGSNGLYSGPGIFKFSASNWKIVAVCVPADSIKEISIASSYGNFVENGKICSGPKAISVEGANGSDAIDYKMWVIQTQGLNDPDSFTFKTI